MRRRLSRQKSPPDTVIDRLPEWRLQAEMVGELGKLHMERPGAFEFAASLEGVIGHLNPYQAKLATATGVKRGETDLRLYFPGARLVSVEVKGEGGTLSKVQRERHAALTALGFAVVVLKVETLEEARQGIRAIIERELAECA